MDQDNKKLEELIEVVQREHRNTRIVFGVSIIILAIVLMLIAPAVVRTYGLGADESALSPSSGVPSGSDMPPSSGVQPAEAGTSTMQ